MYWQFYNYESYEYDRCGFVTLDILYYQYILFIFL